MTIDNELYVTLTDVWRNQTKFPTYWLMNEEYDKIYYTNDKLVEQSEVQNLHTLLDLICLREESSWRSSCSSSL